MQTVKVDPRSKLRILAYGKPGSGKTTFAASAALDPRTSPVLWIDAGGNPISIAHTVSRAGGDPFNVDNVSVVRLDRIEELETVYAWIANGQNMADQFAVALGAKAPFKTLVFDGFTHVQRMSFDGVMNTAGLMPGRVPPRAEWSHFRSVLGQMIVIASKFYTLPLHIIATALEDSDRKYVIPGDDRTAYDYAQPLFQGQTRDELPSWALNVGRMVHAGAFDKADLARRFGNAAANAATTVMQFERTRLVDAKNQHNVADYWIDPTVTAILDEISAKAPKSAPTK